MRVWDIPVGQLCDKHLIAQHHEIHCIYNIITKNLKGFAHHPEVMRWRTNLDALEWKHDGTVDEMLRRGFNHNSPLHVTYDKFTYQVYVDLWQPVEIQRQLLLAKNCGCLGR